MQLAATVVVSVLAAHVLAWAAVVYLVFVPVGGNLEVARGPGGRYEVTEYASTFIDAQPDALEIVVFPLALTVPALGAVVVVRRRRRLRHIMIGGPAILLGGFCVITGFSIGVFYLPAAAALVVAGLLDLVEPERQEQG